MLSEIAKIFGYVMNFIYDIVQNYGISIILFTIFVKILLLPLAIKQQKSMEKMQEIQPLYQELQRKYGNDNQKLSAEYQKLLKEKNMSMASGMGCSGCLLQLIQLPIILGLFYMMMSPLTYILKLPKEQIDTYKDNLNKYYAEQYIEKQSESGELTEAQKAEYRSGDYLSNSRYIEIVIAKQENLFNMDFCGLDLGASTSENTTHFEYFILPVLCVLVTYLSLQMSSNDMKKKQQGNKVQENNDEKNLTTTGQDMQMPNMKYMNFMMPLMTGYIAYIAPQGLALYWTTNSLLQFVQMIALKKLKKKDNQEEKKDNVIS